MCQIIDSNEIRKNVESLSFENFQIRNELKNRLIKTLFQKMKFFVDIDDTKFNRTDVFFEKKTKFDSCEKKFQNNVKIDSMTNSRSIRIRKMIRQQRHRKF